MKTSVTMVRKMGAFEVLQRTNDGMFNATSLVKQWNQKNKRKDVSEFLSNKNTLEFIEALIKDENLTTGNPVFKTHAINKGKYGGTWMSPLLFIDFAMWLNPSFKVTVLKFVYDELIKQRNEAGDGYKSLSASLVKLKGHSFQEVATAMQWIVYGKTGKELRQIATQEQLQEINEIQTKLSFAIDMGYIENYQKLISEMRKIYNKKYQKF